MKERGYQQAQKFSWDKSVHRILDAYRHIAEEGRPTDVRPRTESTTTVEM
jgi:hypothetical protein